MVAGMTAEQLRGVDGHGAVEEDPETLQPASLLQLLEMEQERLRPADGEGRDDDGAATRRGPLDDLAEDLRGIDRLADAIAIGGFHHEIIRRLDRRRIGKDGIVVAAEIAGEDHALAAPGDLDDGGAENMPGMAQPDPGAARDILLLIEGKAGEMRQRALGIGDAVERQGRLMLGEAVTIGEFRVLLLQMAAVRQQDAAEIRRRLGAMDARPKSVAHQSGQIAGMVEMGMGEDDAGQAPRRDGKGRPSSAGAAASAPGTGRNPRGCAGNPASADGASRSPSRPPPETTASRPLLLLPSLTALSYPAAAPPASLRPELLPTPLVF